jgi:hypothetical protein
LFDTYANPFQKLNAKETLSKNALLRATETALNLEELFKRFLFFKKHKQKKTALPHAEYWQHLFISILEKN